MSNISWLFSESSATPWLKINRGGALGSGGRHAKIQKIGMK